MCHTQNMPHTILLTIFCQEQAKFVVIIISAAIKQIILIKALLQKVIKLRKSSYERSHMQNENTKVSSEESLEAKELVLVFLQFWH